MKNFIVLLTSLLLVSGASANEMPITDCKNSTSSREEYRKCFEDASLACAEDGRTFRNLPGGKVQCGERCADNADKSYLFFGRCVSANYVADIERRRPGDIQMMCNRHDLRGSVCEDYGVEINAAFCAERVMVFNQEKNTCEFCSNENGFVVNNKCSRCPADYSWQPVHSACLRFSDLGRYCNGLGEVYSPKTDACESSCLDGRTPDNDSVCR